MRLVYIAHPVAEYERGDRVFTTAENVALITQIVERLYKLPGTLVPVAPYLTPLMLGWDKEDDSFDRARALIYDCEYVKRCDEIWLYGDHISAGMWQEICVAMASGVKVVCMTPETTRDFNRMFVPPRIKKVL